MYASHVSGPGSPAEVELVEIAGNETFLHLEAGGSRCRRTRRWRGCFCPSAGSTVRVGADAKHLYLFDAATGESLT